MAGSDPRRFRSYSIARAAAVRSSGIGFVALTKETGLLSVSTSCVSNSAGPSACRYVGPWVTGFGRFAQACRALALQG